MYKIELTRQAGKDLEKIFRADRKLYQRFINAFHVIAEDPNEGKPLQGDLKGLHSYRMGSYRVLYETRRKKLIVIIIDLGHRKEI